MTKHEVRSLGVGDLIRMQRVMPFPLPQELYGIIIHVSNVNDHVNSVDVMWIDDDYGREMVSYDEAYLLRGHMSLICGSL